MDAVQRLRAQAQAAGNLNIDATSKSSASNSKRLSSSQHSLP